MATIEVEIEINAPVDRVWEVVSDIDNEPRFWKGTKEVRNISKKGNKINREIIIAFRDQRCLQEVTIVPKEKIETRFTEGIIDGEKIVSVIADNGTTVLRTYWDIKMTGMMGMFTGMVKRHIKGGTIQAMQAIKDKVEGRQVG